MTALQPYPAYRASGVEWLGEVPEHWDVRRTKTLLMQRSEKGHPNEPLLAATQTKGVVRKENYESRTVLATKDLHLLKLVRYGDFVISLRSFQGGIEYARERGIISPAYTILFAVQPENHGYLAHLFKSDPYVRSLSLFVTGIRQGQNIDYAALARSRLPLPPIGEQRAIVHFLDYADRRIRRYIRAKERLIELLEEQKQAVIHRAVTGQIDVRTGQPYPAYKDSGVEWLGEVPEHWHTNRIKTLARPGYKNFVDGDWIESPYITDDGIRLIQTGNIGVGAYREQGFRYVSESTFNDFGCTEFQPGDLLICRLGEPVARACLAPHLGKRMITSVDVCILRPKSDMSAEFLVYCMSSQRYLGWVASLVRGSTRDRVSRSMLGGFSLPIPPPSEQAAVTDYLDRTTGDLGDAIARCSEAIHLLSEYRTRLVADIVTGQRDVREAAATLPDIDRLAAEDTLKESRGPIAEPEPAALRSHP